MSDLNGVLLLDKPEDIGSAAALREIGKHLGRDQRIGHAGTLDPFASGLLPVLLGEGTKLAPWLTAHDKRYATTLRLGRSTDTLDRTGATIEALDEEPLQARIAALDVDFIARAVASLRGAQQQRPPMYSAKKQDGIRLHRLARGGIVVDRQAVPIEIHALEIVALRLPEIDLVAHVSSGTYVRVLCTQLAEILGLPGHVSSLRRLSVGRFDISGAVPLSALLDGTRELKPMSCADALAMPRATLDGEATTALIQGKPVALATAEHARGTELALVDPAGKLIGIGFVIDGDRVQPKRIIRDS